MKIYDISLPLCPQLVCWPGKRPFSMQTTRSLCRGDSCTTHTFSSDIHFGTHIDAPAHFIADGVTVDQVALDRLLGPCRVIAFEGSLGSDIPSDIMAGH